MAREALESAAAVRPDLIIFDLGLPDGNGTEVTRQLREWSKIPIIWINGGDVLDPSGKVIVDNPKGVAAMAFILDLVRKSHVAPPGVATLATDDTRVAFQDGRAVFPPELDVCLRPLPGQRVQGRRPGRDRAAAQGDGGAERLHAGRVAARD